MSSGTARLLVPAWLPPSRTSQASLRASDVSILPKQLRWFLQNEIDFWKPNLIVVVERKGTALLRALKESGLLSWPWIDVVSSAVLGQLPRRRLQAKRILVFDDLMRYGRHLSDVLKDLKRLGVAVNNPDNVRVAVFAVHTKPQDKEGQKRVAPSSSFFANLNTQAYEEKRSGIVDYLQGSGSLMLDTEHLEVRVQIRSTFNEFLHAVSRRAHAVAFHSLHERTNITVYYPDDEAHKLDDVCRPSGSIDSEIVKKCRFVQREPQEFAIIPICYPSTPTSEKAWAEWPSSPLYRSLFGDALHGHEHKDRAKSQFYRAGLLSALKVLSWAVRDLYIAGADLYPITLPSDGQKLPTEKNGSPTTTSAYTLEHLGVMYPNLIPTALTAEITRICCDAATDAAKYRRSHSRPSQNAVLDDGQLRDNAIQLLQLIRESLDARIAARISRGIHEYMRPDGLTCAEIFALGESIGMRKEMTSALFDVLIDDAYLVTHVEERQSEHGEMLVRTFEPDGEIVSRHLRTMAAEWRLCRRS